MKARPTDLDRKAATLFTPAPGTRAYVAGAWVRVADADYGYDEDGQCASDIHSVFPVDAIDTDDPATVGCMLAHVEAATDGSAVTMSDRRCSMPHDSERRFMVLVDLKDGGQTTATGPTRGAALVAAMLAIRGTSP